MYNSILFLSRGRNAKTIRFTNDCVRVVFVFCLILFGTVHILRSESFAQQLYRTDTSGAQMVLSEERFFFVLSVVFLCAFA